MAFRTMKRSSFEEGGENARVKAFRVAFLPFLHTAGLAILDHENQTGREEKEERGYECIISISNFSALKVAMLYKRLPSLSHL